MYSAANDLGIQLIVQTPVAADGQSVLDAIDAVFAQAPMPSVSGLIVAIPDTNFTSTTGVRARVVQLMNSGVAVGSVHSGEALASDTYLVNNFGMEKLIFHVGPDNYGSGWAVARRLLTTRTHNFTRALCVYAYSGNAAIDARCQGFADAMAAAGVACESLLIPDALGNPESSTFVIGQVLIRTTGPPPPDVVFGSNAIAGLMVARALLEHNLKQVGFGVMEISPDVSDFLYDRVATVGADPQLYMQGYLSVRSQSPLTVAHCLLIRRLRAPRVCSQVMLMALYNRTAQRPVTRFFQTGPVLLDFQTHDLKLHATQESVGFPRCPSQEYSAICIDYNASPACAAV